MRGDRISTTAYDVEMNVGYDCRVLCGSSDSPSKFDEAQSTNLHYRITQEYFIHLIIGKLFWNVLFFLTTHYQKAISCVLIADNLPCATVFQIPETTELQYEPGFRLGFVRGDKAYINNHLSFQLKYHYSETSFPTIPIHFTSDIWQTGQEACNFYLFILI